MTRGLLQYGGNTVKVWIDDSGEGITASSGRPLSAIKFRAFADKYKAEVLPQMKPASVASITSVLSTLCRSFGDERLSGIRTEKIQKFITGFPHSPKTLKNQIGVFRMAWTKARAWGYVKHNPFEFLSMPRAPLSEARTLSAEEVRAIIRKTDEPFKTMLWILAETGCRGGELVGLYRSDITGNSIRIARSAFRKQIQTPKTVNAVREIAISGRLSDHLHKFGGPHNLVQTASGLGVASPFDSASRSLGMPANSLLFSMPDGRPWDNGEIVRRLKPVLGSGVGLHAFRHFNISLMDSLGVPDAIQKERAGHSSGGVTSRYRHGSPEDHRRWAEEIGRACVGTENKLAMGMGAD